MSGGLAIRKQQLAFLFADLPHGFHARGVCVLEAQHIRVYTPAYAVTFFEPRRCVWCGRSTGDGGGAGRRCLAACHDRRIATKCIPGFGRSKATQRGWRCIQSVWRKRAPISPERSPVGWWETPRNMQLLLLHACASVTWLWSATESAASSAAAPPLGLSRPGAPVRTALSQLL